MTKEEALEFVEKNLDMEEKSWTTECHHHGYYETYKGMSKGNVIELINKIFG